ncbi:MAG: fibronectin type III domain-containing protein [Micropruina sp.]
MPAPTKAQSYSMSAPTALATTGTATTGVALTWKPPAGATRYRVQVATNVEMTQPTSHTVSTARIDITGLKPATRYWFRARVIASDGTNLSSYTPAHSATTLPADGYSRLAPVGLSVSSDHPTRLTASFNDSGVGVRYRVRYRVSPQGAYSYSSASTLTRTLTGLNPATTYAVSVALLDPNNVRISQYSPAVDARTLASAPGGVALVSRSQTALAVEWAPLTGASRYQVRFSTSSSFSQPRYVYSATPYAELTGLAKGVAYYLQVRAVTADGTALSARSTAVAFQTRSSGFTSLSPHGLTVTTASSTTATAVWSTRGAGVSYRVRITLKDAAPTYLTVSAATASLTGLLPGRSYSVAVAVTSSSAVNLSTYSAPVEFDTEVKMSGLTVASFNVRCANCYEGLPNELPWSSRSDAVADRIVSSAPAVIGLQEASQAWLKDADGDKVNLSQFEDLVRRMGSPYRLTNTHRNNCVDSSRPSRCVYKDQGASLGTKIVYDSTKVTLLTSGSQALSRISGDLQRYVVWGTFRHRASGKDFFFANAHLENRLDTSGSTLYYTHRIKQTKDALAEIRLQNTRNLPVIFVGDLNSHKWRVPSNGPYELATSNGFVDPLGNTYRSSTAPTATVEKRINTHYNTWNAFQRQPPASRNINGTHVDYLLTTPMRVSQWETVVKVDASGQAVGVIPSDHHLIKATVYLP